MAEYQVLAGQTITDAILNSCGDISAWESFLNENDFSSWTPDLFSGQILQIPTTITPNQTILADLKEYPANNFTVPDIYAQIDSIFGILAGAMSGFAPVITPTVIDTNTYYNMRQGEGVLDLILNSTGDIINWSDILNENDFSTWTPDLHSGQIVKIPASVIPNLNNFRGLNTYPANNFTVPDIYEQINSIFDRLNHPDDWILRTGFWEDIGYWRDYAFWID